MKTWQYEMLVVIVVLFGVNAFRTPFAPLEMLAATAVVLSFGHTQIADRMAEQESRREKPMVECYRKLWYYFVAKESFWCLYFLLNHSYSALAGVVIFLCYPIWRGIYRRKIKRIE